MSICPKNKTSKSRRDKRREHCGRLMNRFARKERLYPEERKVFLFLLFCSAWSELLPLSFRDYDRFDILY